MRGLFQRVDAVEMLVERVWRKAPNDVYDRQEIIRRTAESCAAQPLKAARSAGFRDDKP
jgi:hypothetical protein